MASSDYGFIARPPESNSLGSIANVLGIAGKAQEMQRGAQAIQLGNVELQKNQIGLDERKAIQSLFSNPASFRNQSGQMDYNKLIELGMQAAPTTFPAMIPNIITSHRQGLDAQKALGELDQQTRTQAGMFVMSLVDKPPEEVKRLLDEAKKDRPQLGPAFDFAWNQRLSRAQGPDAFRTELLRMGQAVMTPAEQAQAMTPKGYEATNQEHTGYMNLSPMAGPPGIVPQTMVRQQIPLNQRQTVAANPITGNYDTTTKDAFGVVQGVTQTPTGPGIQSLAIGQKEDIPKVVEIRNAANQLALDIPTQRFNNREIIKLAPESFTGTNAELWAKAFALIDPNWDFRGKSEAANFQRLAHYMAVQRATMAKTMGGAGTDQARDMAAQVAGNPEWKREAIIENAKVNDALALGTEAFNSGMEASIAKAGGNVLAARDFQNKWARAFDPDVFRLANAKTALKEAIKPKEIEAAQADIDKIMGGPKGTAARDRRAQELARKVMVLERLIQGQ